EIGPNPFLLPARRSLEAELATARAFLVEAGKRVDAFVGFGLAPTFISEFETLVNDLQQAVDTRLGGKAERRQAREDTSTALATGFEAVRDLDAFVAI